MMESVKLLLVDDLEENLLTLEAVFRRDDIQLLQAKSGSEALELLLVHDVALAIVDVQMPIMDGFELAELMRGMDRTRRVPIIFLTAGSHNKYRQFRGYESGAVDFLFKPFDPKILTSKAEVFIELYRQRQEIARQRDALRESEARLRMALSAAELATWTWNVPADELQFSDDFASRQGIEAKQVPATMLDYIKLIHPSDKERFQTTLQESLAHGNRFECEFRVLKADQQVRWVLAMAKVERSFSGKPLRYVGVKRDISADKKVERELRSLSDNSPNIIARFDPQLRLIFVNKAIEQILDVAPAALLEKTIFEMGLSDSLSKSWDNGIRRVFETGKSESLQFSFPSPNGERHFETQLVAETDTEGRVEYVLAVTRDMTVEWRASRELTQAKAMAESANAAKDQFLAVLSHELRNPLAPIRMLVSLWELDHTLRPEFREGLEMIRQNIDLECRLIDDMLDVNRIAKGKIELKSETVDVHDVIHHAIQIVEPDAINKQLTISVQADAQYSRVQGDSARIQQILWNLLNNAVKFTQEGGKILVRTFNTDDSRLKIEVQDNGVGIEPAAIRHIFDAFEQGGSHVTRQFGGLGLGLAISQALAELHGGSLKAFSEGRDQGATFQLDLGLAPDYQLPPSPDQHPPTQAVVSSVDPQASDQLQILLIEDQLALARLTERLLVRIGHHVVIAGSVAMAHEKWQEKEFDLVISDFGLPDGDGCDLLRDLLTQKPVPAIALTGSGMEEDIARAHSAGFLAHLTKPVSFDHLSATIRQVMEGDSYS